MFENLLHVALLIIATLHIILLLHILKKEEVKIPALFKSKESAVIVAGEDPEQRAINQIINKEDE